MGRRGLIAVLAVAVVALAAATAFAWDRGGEAASAPPPAPSTTAAAGLDGRALFAAKGCAVCHFGPAQITGFQIGPDLRGLRAAGSRVAGLSAAEYARRSIVAPAAFTVAGYGPMPSLGVAAAEADALVAYLLAEPAR